MTNLKEVLEFIKNSNQSDFAAIKDVVAIRRTEINHAVLYSFHIGDIVGINHKTVPAKDTFRVLKINNTNIKVTKVNVDAGRVGGILTVSPGLLVKI